MAPIANANHVLYLTNINWDGPESYTAAETKAAKLEGRSLTRRLRGTWVLGDLATGQPIDERHMTIATVPVLGDDGAYVLNGTNYLLPGAQLRLRPGVYARQKSNGEYESHVNALPGQGRSFRITLDPETGSLGFSIGQSTVPLTTALRTIGVTHDDLVGAVGKDLADLNRRQDDGRGLDRLYSRLLPRGQAADPETKSQEVAAALRSTVLDPDVTTHTLGRPYTSVDRGSMLAATSKLVRVARGEVDPDDRDNLAYMMALGPEDLISERLRTSRGMVQRALWKVSRDRDLKSLPVDLFGPAVRGAILSSGVGQAGESINPLMDLDNRYRATRLGEGGIESTDSVPIESRAVQPSYLMFIDPLVAPECFDGLTEVLTEAGWLYWPDVTATDQFATLVDGQFGFRPASKIHVQEYDGYLITVSGTCADFAVTSYHRLWVHDASDQSWKFIPADRCYGRDLSLAGSQPRDGGDSLLHVPSDAWGRVRHVGRVYCATVPGGLVCVRRRVGSSRPDDQHGHWSGNSLKIGVDSRFAARTLIGSDRRLYSPFRDVATGRVVYRHPGQLVNSVIAFPGELESGSPWVTALQRGRMTYVSRDKVDYVPLNTESQFTNITNLVPFKSTVKGQRAVMAGRMMTQALPLEGAEAALVQTGVPGGRGLSYDHHLGEAMGAVRSSFNGRVREVRDDFITIDTPEGRRRVDLRVNDPSNRKTMVNQTPVVAPGQPVAVGQLLARSNFTDDGGTLALGRNLRTAYVAGFGNWEDAYSISESAAAKLRSIHAYQHTVDVGGDVHIGRSRYIGMYPTKFNANQLKTLDDDGVVKKGTVVRYGDPITLVVRDKEPTFASLQTARKSSFEDASLTWDHHEDGVVTDAVKTKTGVNVVVKSTMPMKVGDKLCFDDQTDVLTSDGWKKVADVTIDDHVAVLVDGQTATYRRPEAVHHYQHDGPMFRLVSPALDMLVTEDHRLWVSPRGEDCRAVSAREVFESRDVHRFHRDLHWTGCTIDAVVAADKCEVSASVWMSFLGRWVARGRSTLHGQRQALILPCAGFSDDWHYVRDILETLRLGWLYGDQFHLDSRVYRSALGLRNGEPTSDVLPAGLRTVSPPLLWAFLDGYLDAVGRQRDDDVWPARSEVLAGELQIVSFKMGRPAIVRQGDDCWLVVADRDPDGMLWSRDAMTDGDRAEMVPYQGGVHCVTVPGGLVFCRRNGKAHWSHNSGRYGDKGVVAQIVPDHLMPRDGDGQPFEVLANPLGIISRTNVGQVYETVLGKIAAKTGKPYVVQDFEHLNNAWQYVADEAAQHGVKAADTIVDPQTGRRIPRVLTGNRYFMKLHHQAEGKLSGRGTGGYTADGMPAKGGSSGSKWISLLNANALLSHGATAVLRDAGAFRGQAHADFWSRFMAGHDMPDPETPQVYGKFLNQLKASGINVVREGSKMRLLALTDHDVQQLAGDRELQNPETVDQKGQLRPVPGGLFDEGLTGGHGSKDRWSKITLAEPMVSPAFEEPVRRVLGLTEKQFRDAVAGRHDLGGYGSGPKAVAAALGAINLDREIGYCREAIRSGQKTKRDDAVRKLGYLLSAKQLGLHPRDWVLHAVPVLPPAFRPVSIMRDNKMLMVNDANLLYRELWDANHNLRSLKGRVDDLGAERLALYDAFKGVVGLGDPIHPKNQEKQVKGILAHIFADAPKHGAVQRKLIGATTDLVGRAVIAPDPSLDIDEVALPENSAWEVYKPFVVRRLVRSGMDRVGAVRATLNRDPRAKQMLLEEMDARPVMVDRAPVLHRYGAMALRPRLTHDDVMKLPPAIYKGFNADNDGDAVYDYVYCAIRRDALDRVAQESGTTPAALRSCRVELGLDCRPQAADVYAIHLEDFPHGPRYRTSAGQYGEIDWHAVPDGVLVLALQDDGGLRWTQPTVWSRHPGMRLEIVDLASGRQHFTDDDPRAIVGVAAGSLTLERATPTDALRRRFLVPCMRSHWRPTSDGPLEDGEEWRTASLRQAQHLVQLRRAAARSGRIDYDAASDQWVVRGRVDRDKQTWALSHGGHGADDDVVPIDRQLATDLSRRDGIDRDQAWHLLLGARNGFLSRRVARRAIATVARLDHPGWDHWSAIVDDNYICWDRVVAVQYVDKSITGHDLTVPGSETFVLANGVVASNTMQFHVPFSDDAAREMMEKMLPSRNLFSPATFAVHQLPNNEFAAGLYMASTGHAQGATRVFATRQDAIRAYRRGEINHDTPVRIVQH